MNRHMATKMIDSLFHASGNPSISMVRQLFSLLPNAIVVTDVETTEILAMTKTAQALFGLNNQRWYEGASFYKNPADWNAGLEKLESEGGGPLRMITTLNNPAGDKFTAICWVQIATMAGRRVFVTSLEPGEPQDISVLPPPVFFTVETA